ncbi:MAG: rod shape-determining protein MreC [Hyphomicrobium sp.]
MRNRRTFITGSSTTRGVGPTIVFLFLSIGFLMLSRLEHRYITSVRWHVAEIMSPLLHAAMVPLGPVRDAFQTLGQAFTLGSEFDRLLSENQRLKEVEWRSQELLRKYSDLAAASNTAKESEIDFITARVVSISSGAFVRSAMINAGSEQGLKSSYPVVSGDGLIGRVVDAGSNIARVLLITDGQSRIPVYVGPNSVRAVLAGDNGPHPRIVLPAPNRELNIGDEVSTSGIGGLFPRGIRIGKIIEL